MPLHHQAAALLEGLAALGVQAMEDQTPAEARAQRQALLRPSPEPIAEWRDVDADGVACRWYRPSARRNDGLFVWFHGGGWVVGDLDAHDDPCRSIANRAGCRVLSVAYRLAPEHPFPAALDDCRTATRWSLAHAAELDADPARVAVGGDSAGGTLAAVVAWELPGMLRRQVLVYPPTDARLGHPSHVENGEGYFLTAAGLRWAYGHYLSGDERDVSDPRISPLVADEAVLAAGPPALVVTAEYDPLRDEGDEYARRLAAAGVATTHVRFEGQIHGFFTLFGLLDDARTAQALVAEALHTSFA